MRTPSAVLTNITNNQDYADGLPFDGVVNNINKGWIASSSGTGRFITADFCASSFSMTEFGAFSSYTGGARGATWQVAWSEDSVNWSTVATLNYSTCNNCASEASNGTGGWYTVSWSTTQNQWTSAALEANLALWLDAADASTITLNGSTVSQWTTRAEIVVTQVSRRRRISPPT